MCRTLIAAATAAFLFTGVSQAQTPDPQDRPTTGVPIARADRMSDFDSGWLGLIGLLGLAGLAGRRRDRYTTDRGADVRTDRI